MGQLLPPAHKFIHFPSAQKKVRHVARILLRRGPQDIFIYVRYFKPDSFHATPIDVMLEFVRISFYFSVNWIDRGGAMTPVALPLAG